jgi:hypothetical protein
MCITGRDPGFLVPNWSSANSYPCNTYFASASKEQALRSSWTALRPPLFLPLSPPPSIDILSMTHHQVSPLFRLLTPLLQTIRSSITTTSTPALRQHALSTPFPRHFSMTSPMLAGGSGGRNNAKPKKDPRITLIRYHLQHPKTPRPLRFSRMRALRHWTIHRAWMLFRRKKAAAEALELQRYG